MAVRVEAELSRAHLRQGMEAADACLRGGDRHKALRIMEGLRGDFPDEPDPVLRTSAILRQMLQIDECVALLDATHGRFPDHPEFLYERASAAHQRGNFDLALSIWQQARDRFEGDVRPWLGISQALRAGGRMDDAQALLADIAARFPDLPAPLVEHARFELHRRNLDEAARRWAAVRARFPDMIVGYAEGAVALRAAQRIGEAEELLDAAVARLGDDPRFAAERVLLALNAAPLDITESLRRATHLRERFPAYEPGFALAVNVLRRAGRFDEADAVAHEGMLRAPHDVALAIQHAEVARARNDLPETIGRLAEFRQRFPRHPFGFAVLVDVLAAQGRMDEAERAAAEGMQALPGEGEIARSHASLLLRRREWPAALRAFEALRARFPSERQIDERLLEIRTRLIESDSEVLHLHAAPEPAHRDCASMGETMMQFESLGGSQNGCEFGLVQRAFKAEPLALLRWTEIEPDKLVAALEAGFSGVGDVAQTELRLDPVSGRPEYMTRDRRFGMRMHTFVHSSDIPHQAMLEQCCRRLQFLRRKLLDDLTTASKIFVYRITMRNLSSEEINRLHAALRRSGPATLLYVRYADEQHPNGTVEAAGPGLMIGFIDRFNVSPGGRVADPAIASWETICQRAHALWRAEATATGERST